MRCLNIVCLLNFSNFWTGVLFVSYFAHDNCVNRRIVVVVLCFSMIVVMISLVFMASSRAFPADWIQLLRFFNYIFRKWAQIWVFLPIQFLLILVVNEVLVKLVMFRFSLKPLTMYMLYVIQCLLARPPLVVVPRTAPPTQTW